MHQVADEIKAYAREITPSYLKGIFWRLVSFVISSTFFSIIPITLFIIHMNQYQYFSYDFFEKGFFGLKSFFALMMVMTILIALMLFGILVPIGKWLKEKKAPHIKDYWIYLLFTLFGWSIVATAIFYDTHTHGEDIFLAIAVSFLVMIHLVAMKYAKPKQQFLSLIAVALTFFTLMFNYRESVARSVDKALLSFGVGGIECVEVTDKQGSYRISGYLLLSSPDFLYLRKSQNEPAVTHIKIDSSTIYTVGKECRLGVTN